MKRTRGTWRRASRPSSPTVESRSTAPSSSSTGTTSSSTSRTSNVPGQIYIANVGGATSKGVEFDLTARPAPGLDVFGAFGYTNATFSSGSTSVGMDVVGNDIPNTPDYTASFGVQYGRALNFGERAPMAAPTSCSPARSSTTTTNSPGPGRLLARELPRRRFAASSSSPRAGSGTRSTPPTSPSRSPTARSRRQASSARTVPRARSG